MDLSNATRLDLFEAKQRLANMTDRELIKVIPKLREALGMTGYGGDYARENKATRLRRANEYTERLSNKNGFVPGSCLVTFDAPKHDPEPETQTALPELAEQHAHAELANTNGDPHKAEGNAAERLAKALAETLGDVLGDSTAIDKRIDAAVSAALDARVPNRVELQIGDLPPVDLTGKHPMFSLVYALVNLPKDLRPNILLVGPAGCGKTTLGHQIAQALGRRFGTTSLSAGVSESAMTGWLLPVKDNGAFGYVPASFAKDYGEGAVHLLDELDAADPNMLCIVNAALANGHLYVQQKLVDGDAAIVKHEDTVILCAANTYGTGANELYQGRNALDAATLDRFLLLELDYDEGMELRSMGITDAKSDRPWSPSASTNADELANDLRILGNWIVRLRAAVTKGGIRRVVSTRMFHKAKALRAVGCSVSETKTRLLTGWTDDEKAALSREGCGV